jgi:hypothetical protein
LDRPAGSRSEIEETHVRAVPDFARWTPPVEDGGVAVGARAIPAGELGAGVGVGQGADADFRSEGDGIGRDELVTLMVTGQGGQSNVQNEIAGSQLSVVSGQSSVVSCPLSVVSGQSSEVSGPLSAVSGQLDGGVCDGAGLAGARTVGGKQTGDGDQTIRSVGRQRASQSGERTRGLAGGSNSPGRDASPKKRRLTERYWRRDRKQLRKLLAAIEIERRKAEKEDDEDDVIVKHTLESLAWRLPNVAKVLGAFHPRSP